MVTHWRDKSLAVLVIVRCSFWRRLTATRTDLINVWWFLFNHHSTNFCALERAERTTLSGRTGVLDFKLDHWTSCGAGGGGNKALYCPPFPFEDGTNWLYKRHQRVLLRVPITIRSLGGRPENRKVMSVITAGVRALIRPNGVVLITREASTLL